MGTITIRLRPEQLADFRDNFPSDIDTALANIARRVTDEGRALVHSKLGRWKTGELRDSLRATAAGRTVTTRIGEGVEHADWVFFGAEPHTIKPKSGRALHWNRFGTDYYFGAVKHPGQPARTDIFDALEELVYKIVEEELRAMIIARAMAS